VHDAIGADVVCEATAIDTLVLVDAMIPVPGESPR
jgi:hypothetical protein